MMEAIRELRKIASVGIVGGSDLSKQREQLGDDGKMGKTEKIFLLTTDDPNRTNSRPVLENFDYVFSENGLVAFKQGKILATQSLKEFLGEANLKELLNFLLRLIADQDIPIKRFDPLALSRRQRKT